MTILMKDLGAPSEKVYMKTTETVEFKDAIQLSKLIPLGKKTQAKKDAVHRLCLAWAVMLKAGR